MIFIRNSLRSIFFALLIFLLSIFISGCTGKNQKNAALSFSSWGSQSEIKILKPLIEDFEKQNNIKVEFLHIPQNYFQKIHLLFASKQAPDVVFINNYYLPVYAKAGLLEEVTPYFEKEIKENIFFDNTLKALTYDDKLYAIPRDVSNLVVFYNKSLFDKEGIKYPYENWTYDDFLHTAKKLSKNGVWGIGFEEQPLFWEPILWAFGGKLFDQYGNLALNELHSKEALKFYIDLRNKYNTAPSRTDSANRTMAQMFLDGRIAMQISGRWLVPKYREEASFDWDIVPLPKGKAGSISGSDCAGWAISRDSENKELAARFIKHMSSQKSVEKITENGLITPARKDAAYSSAFLDGKSPKNAKTFLEINKNAIVTPTPEHYNQKIVRLMKMLEPFFTGTKEITETTTFEL